MTALINTRQSSEQHAGLTQLWLWSVPVLIFNISNNLLSQCFCCSSAFLHRTSLRFQLDKLFCHLVSRPLGQDAHHRHARLVGLNAWPERTPAHAALAVGHVTQLNHSYADHPVCPAKTVVLHRHLELIAVWRLLSQDTTEQQRRWKTQWADISLQINTFVAQLFK